MSTDPNDLAEPLGTLVRYAIAAARRDGRTLFLTSGRRTNAEQVALRRAHCGTTPYEIYEAPSASCSPPTARPGESKHETGQAADMAGDTDWMARLLSQYGVTRPVGGEEWHFEFRGSDASGTLQHLAENMGRQGYDQAAIAAVFVHGQTPAPSGPTASGNPLTDLASSAANMIPGVSEARALAGLVGKLADPTLWRRAGMLLLGIVLVLAAIAIVKRDAFTQLPQTIGSANA